MIILLDIDGVLVTTPAWRQTDSLSDGFMKFNEETVKNLAILYANTNADIVLTTTHRINYSLEEWREIFQLRGLNFKTIDKLNDKTEVSHLLSRGAEIKEWVEKNGHIQNFVIIDDDPSINALPHNIKERWVSTKPLLGFDKDSLEKALHILNISAKFPCPCCGHKTYLDKPDGTYLICPVCFWEDDPIQLGDPDYAGGANRTSLKQAQQNYIKFGACEMGMIKSVRPPNAEEPKDENWKPYDSNG